MEIDKAKDNKALRLADRRSSSWLTLILLLISFGVFGYVLFNPLNAVLDIAAIIAWLGVCVALLRIWASTLPKPKTRPISLSDDLPLYTVLVPLFREANMVQGLIKTLSQLNYPKDKLEIFFLCEEVDPETVTAVEQHLRPPFKLLVTPKGLPQTKPRALNYALKFAKGEFVTIYDAEDQPHPNQLLSALQAFEDNPYWTTLQAPLDYYNSDDNLLTRQFTLEYAALFHVWLPFMAKLGIPFPLGGTSNHMRRSALDACEGWDAHNVTEDADLSFRLAALSDKIGYITPPTDEEAVSDLKMWHNQRTRWMKGYIQTWLVHMHRPIKPLTLYGVLRFLSLQFTLAYSVLSALIFTPVLIGGLIYSVGYFAFDWRMPFSAPYFFALGLSLSVGILIGMVGVYRAGKPHLIKWALLMPFYWVLLFWPTLRAVIELHTRRFHWHKTDHGVSPSRASQAESFVEPTQQHLPAE